jgi:hypothetical protein
MSACGTSRHFACANNQVAFRSKRTSIGRQDRLDRSRMTPSGHAGSIDAPCCTHSGIASILAVAGCVVRGRRWSTRQSAHQRRTAACATVAHLVQIDAHGQLCRALWRPTQSSPVHFRKSPPRGIALMRGGFVVTTSNRLLRFNWLILPGQAIAPRGGRWLHAASTGRFYRDRCRILKSPKSAAP